MGVRNAARAVNSLVPGNLFRAPPTGPAAADVMPRRKPLAVVARTVGASRPRVSALNNPRLGQCLWSRDPLGLGTKPAPIESPQLIRVDVARIDPTRLAFTRTARELANARAQSKSLGLQAFVG